MIAEQVYDLEVGVSTSEAQDSTMWANANNLYDLQGMNFSWINRQEAFKQNYLYDCGNWGFMYDDGGGLPGGYFEVGDFDPLYPPDGEGNYHPFDYHIVDVVNMQYFNHRSAQSKEEWFPLIWDYIIDQEYPFLDAGNEWCFWKCGKDPDTGHGGAFEPEYRCFHSDFCPGYKRIVTEHEFWQHKDSIIDTFQVHTGTSTTIHNIYDIEKSLCLSATFPGTP